MQERVLVLVSGNASWWKSRKYRKESAQTLRRLKRQGWRLVGFERIASAGVDTRRRTAYHLMQWITPTAGNTAPDTVLKIAADG